MKIIITESQKKKILDKYFADVIDSSEYDFVDRIEINETTTKVGNWRNEFIFPYYHYIIYLNSDGSKNKSLLDDLYRKISDTHAILFPITEKGTPQAYYSIESKFSM